jgi:small subunit ribosomal protein S17
MERGRRKVRMGVVSADKMNKTRTIEVARDFRDSKYEKVMKRRTKFYAHDEKNETHVGDRVRIMETRPLSRLKRWNIVEVIKKA